MQPEQKLQSERFLETARSIECDEDEARWEDRLRKIARQKPADEPAPPEPEK